MKKENILDIKNIKLHIDERWELTDLNMLTRVYIQVYGLLYSLDVAYKEEEIKYIYRKYPWRGGYSAVNFYQNLPKYRGSTGRRLSLFNTHHRDSSSFPSSLTSQKISP